MNIIQHQTHLNGIAVVTLSLSYHYPHSFTRSVEKCVSSLVVLRLLLLFLRVAEKFVCVRVRVWSLCTLHNRTERSPPFIISYNLSAPAPYTDTTTKQPPPLHPYVYEFCSVRNVWPVFLLTTTTTTTANPTRTHTYTNAHGDHQP